jgi:divalent metal cation (Fe/Co/Zn/Cd) transporter
MTLMPVGWARGSVGRLTAWQRDERYPGGCEHAEDLAGLGVAAPIWASAVFARVECVRKLVGHGITSHLGLGVVAAAVGVVANQRVACYKPGFG